MVTVIYCTAANVAAFMQLPAFSGSTTPTKEQVEDWIVEAEDEINSQTMNSWKSKSITNEYHTIKPPVIRYEGTQIFIENRNITTLVTPTDKLEVWNGSDWEDYLITRTEGRTNDYWINEVDGILWLRTYPRILRRTFDVRLTYRFSDTLNSEITKACIRLTAVAVIQSDDKSILIPEGSQNIPLFEKTKIWQAEADKIIQNNREIKTAIL